MLLSGAGLLAFALVDLWGAVRDADELARRAARRKTEQIGEALTNLLNDPKILDAVPVVCRFRLRDGAVVIPPEVGWLEEPPALYSEASLPTLALVKLTSARRAEWVDGDRDAATRALTEALAADDLNVRDRQHLLVDAAWQAVRFDQLDKARRFWRRLVANPELPAEAAASAVLLARQLGEEQKRALVKRCLLLPASVRDPLLNSVDWQRQGRAVDQARMVLATVQANRAGLQHGQRMTVADDPRRPWLVLRPGSDAARGALVPVPSLLAWLRGLPQTGQSGQPPEPLASFSGSLPEEWSTETADQIEIAGATGSPDAIRVHEALAVLPVLDTPSTWTDPSVLIVLLTLLVVGFGSGLFFSFRALLRESAAMRSRADFLTSVTHELKTPLSSIRLLSEMLEEGRVRGDTKQREYYRLLAGESARLTVLIENVLDLGRMERGERAYDLRPQLADEVVREAAEVFEPIASRDGMRLTLDLQADARESRVDRGALVQAVLNVMDNARKYAASGGQLEVRSGSANGVYRLSIRDHGPGIAAADRESIFERFQRSDEHRDGNVPGVGLGLYLARVILRAHGGDLTCVSPEDSGAEFVFTLPLSPPPMESAPKEKP